MNITISDNIAMGKLLRTDVSASTKMTLDEIELHMTKHYGQDKSIVKHIAEDTKTTDIMAPNNTKIIIHDIQVNMISSLADSLNKLISDNADTKDIKALASELRLYLQDLRENEDGVYKGSKNTIIQINNIRNIIMSDLCPICKEKVLKLLEVNVNDDDNRKRILVGERRSQG